MSSYSYDHFGILSSLNFVLKVPYIFHAITEFLAFTLGSFFLFFCLNRCWFQPNGNHYDCIINQHNSSLFFYNVFFFHSFHLIFILHDWWFSIDTHTHMHICSNRLCTHTKHSCMMVHIVTISSCYLLRLTMRYIYMRPITTNVYTRRNVCAKITMGKWTNSFSQVAWSTLNKMLCLQNSHMPFIETMTWNANLNLSQK